MVCFIFWSILGLFAGGTRMTYPMGITVCVYGEGEVCHEEKRWLVWVRAFHQL